MWWTKRKREDSELEEELRFHLREEERLLRDRGEDPRRAERDFGNLASVREITRDQWGWGWLERSIQDARFAARLLRKSPGFAITAVAVLALGIGATTAIFSVVNSVLLRPLPFPDPDALVMVWERQPFGRTNVIQTQNFLDWRARNQSFTHISALFGLAMNLSGDGEPVQIPGLRITAGFFEILGVPPMLGRAVAASDDVPGAPAVAVLSYGLWQRRFGGSMDAIGKKITLEGSPVEVIGVMPPGFAYPTIRADLYVPMRLDPANAARDGRNYQSIARLKPGVTLAQAQHEMEAIAAQTERERPAMNTKWSAEVVRLLDQTVGQSRQVLEVMLGAVGFVLLIACANVSNLLLMRAAGRQREMAVRAALGAGRWRLLHQTVIESLMLAAAGGLLGFVLAYWCVPAVVKMLPAGYPLPRRGEIAIDRTVLWFTLATSVTCGLLFGVFPALQVDRRRLSEGLKQGGRTGSAAGRGIRHALVIGEVAVATMLVIGAGLMLHSFVRLNAIDPGYRSEHILAVRMTLIFRKYAADLPRRAAVVRDTLDRIRALPQVQSASSTHSLPTRPPSGTSYDRADRPEPLPGSSRGGDVSVVSDDFFRTMGIPIIAGREFDERGDRMDSPGVVILNRAAAQLLFENENPIGKRLRLAWSGATSPEVIGVAENIRQYGLAIDPQPCVFVCGMQAPSLFATLVIRTRGDPMAATAAVKRAMREVDPDQGTAEIVSMQEVVSNSIAGPRVQTLLLGVFGALGLILACVGIYAVISYSMAQRTREIGIRMALGAAPAKIRALIVREGMTLATAGMVAGILASLALTRYLETLLYAVERTDPPVYVAVCLVLLLTAMAGCWLPARRATAVDPAAVLREE